MKIKVSIISLLTATAFSTVTPVQGAADPEHLRDRFADNQQQMLKEQLTAGIQKIMVELTDEFKKGWELCFESKPGSFVFSPTILVPEKNTVTKFDNILFPNGMNENEARTNGLKRIQNNVWLNKAFWTYLTIAPSPLKDILSICALAEILRDKKLSKTGIPYIDETLNALTKFEYQFENTNKTVFVTPVSIIMHAVKPNTISLETLAQLLKTVKIIQGGPSGTVTQIATPAYELHHLQEIKKQGDIHRMTKDIQVNIETLTKKATQTWESCIENRCFKFSPALIIPSAKEIKNINDVFASCGLFPQYVREHGLRIVHYNIANNHNGVLDITSSQALKHLILVDTLDTTLQKHTLSQTGNFDLDNALSTMIQFTHHSSKNKSPTKVTVLTVLNNMLGENGIRSEKKLKELLDTTNKALTDPTIF